jgi:hypothetical protein
MALPPLDQYNQNILAITQKLNHLYKKRKRIALYRLFAVLLTGVSAYLLFPFSFILGCTVMLIGLCIFLYLVSHDINNKHLIEHEESLLQINKDEIDYISGAYLHQDTGECLEPHEHPYSKDLDLFGKSSLFQYINRASSDQGHQMLASNLLQAIPKNELKARNIAVNELKILQTWRQYFQRFGKMAALNLKSEQRLMNWVHGPPSLINKRWKVIVYVFTTFSLSLTLLCIFSFLDANLFGSLFLFLTVISFYLGKNAIPVHTQLSKIVDQLDTVYRQINHIEKEQFKSGLFRQIQQNIAVEDQSASHEIKRLKNILNRFDYRLNLIVAILLNTFLLWDIRQILALDEWKKKNKELLKKCFEAIATMEVLNSISTLYYNHPEWCFPQWAEEHFTFSGEEIGHPLLSKNKRVDNDFSLKGTGKIALITGSNMSGKSTFLRSLGANMVLAHMGAPVCAVLFTTSYIKLMSSMRITDNLAESTSTFYAELKKLQIIIQSVNNNEPVFILLDEILRGTNSLDRHTGSKAMIQQMIRQNAVAIIASHDVELAEMQKDFPDSLSNYHFDVQVEGEDLHFDYKLKTGVCRSLNASLLMKKIGIEL